MAMSNWEYCGFYDCYYNPHTRLWEESKCQDPECIYCKSKPEKHEDHCECFECDDE